MPGLDALRAFALTTGTLSFWSIAGVLALTTAASFWWGFRNLFRARIIEDTPTAKIRSAPQGYVELSGRGELLDGPPIVSPLSGRRCLWYRYSVEELREDYGSLGRSGRWRTLETAQSDSLFRLVDETGYCIIDPEGAEIHASDSMSWFGQDRLPGSFPLDPPSPWTQIAAQFLPLDLGRYRYTETVLSTGAWLYALGEFRTQGTDFQADLNQDTAAILRAWKRDPTRMRALDADGNGQIDGQEWEAARDAARRQALVERTRTAVISVTHLLRRPSAGGRPYVLSDRTEHRLASSYRLRAAIAMAVFLATGGTVVWLVTLRLAA